MGNKTQVGCYFNALTKTLIFEVSRIPCGLDNHNGNLNTDSTGGSEESRYGKGSEEWGYVDKSAWKKTCKTGKSQSPIDLDISQAILVDWEPLKFHNYDARGDIVAENNGHTELVQGFQSWTKRPYVTGGNLKGRYNLQQFHFHWDGNDRFGSEHTLAGLHYPLEVHFVHIKEGLNETNAHHVVGGVAVVAVQFQIAPKGEALFDLEKVTEATNSSDTKGDVPSYSPGSLLPPDTSTFFRYTGSLTTPPCSEGVIWTILAYPNLVTDTQLRILRRHLKEDGSLLIDNWRTVQPMNGRKLYLNKGTVNREGIDTGELWDITSKAVPVVLICVVFIVVLV
ncbi:hypothetical protein Y032_0283g1303 [Ancylostoma ceylanicum]|uniref:Carbonic anhydrase n=1 Tax=Ancylostoma ceylanicum TaxID=53326 RepID=A0A016S6C7_9BILA|nr:hypothetical protein Y032_0283g1303 [Ancylostoma ceylanicum]